MKRKRFSIRGCLPVANKLVSIITLVFFSASTVFALPGGQQVVNGQATFNTQGNSLTITNSPNSIINWQGFSISSNEAVRFIQQSSSSAVLNRVIGQDPSRILGLLQSNGRVFLINPNGIPFRPGVTDRCQWARCFDPEYKQSGFSGRKIQLYRRCRCRIHPEPGDNYHARGREGVSDSSGCREQRNYKFSPRGSHTCGRTQRAACRFH